MFDLSSHGRAGIPRFGHDRRSRFVARRLDREQVHQSREKTLPCLSFTTEAQSQRRKPSVSTTQARS